MSTCKPFIVAMLAIALTSGVFARESTLLLSTAISNNLVSVDAVGKGGYQGQCLTVNINNKTDDLLNILLDDAIVFTPSDEIYQNLVGIGGDYVTLGPKAASSVTLQTFCGLSNAYCPPAGETFTFLQEGNTALKSVIQFIKLYSLYNDVGQYAVWSVMNGLSLSSIYDPARDYVSNELVDLVASLTGRKAPRYHTTHKPLKTVPGQAVYDPTVEKYYVDVSWISPVTRNVRVSVYKRNGELVKRVDTEDITDTVHRIKVELDPREIPEGMYYVRVRDDDNKVYDYAEVEIERKLSAKW